MNPYKWSTLKISSPCLNPVTFSHVRYPLAFFSPSPWRNLHNQRWCHVPCWGPVGQTARPGPHDEMHLCRQWPRRVDLHRVLPAQRYWSSCPSHCVSVSLGRVGEISFLSQHWQFKPRLKDFVTKVFFGIERESEGLCEVPVLFPCWKSTTSAFVG